MERTTLGPLDAAPSDLPNLELIASRMRVRMALIFSTAYGAFLRADNTCLSRGWAPANREMQLVLLAHQGQRNA